MARSINSAVVIAPLPAQIGHPWPIKCLSGLWTKSPCLGQVIIIGIEFLIYFVLV